MPMPGMLANASPQALVLRGLRDASMSLTLGIFIGSALTSGAVCGVAAFWLASHDRLIRWARGTATALVSTVPGGVARDVLTATQPVAAALGAVLSIGAADGGSGGVERGLLALVRSGKKVLCVGKNYREHVAEMRHLGPEWALEEEEEPVLFLKPSTSLAFPGANLVLPDAARRPRRKAAVQHGVQHELELAVIIGRRCRHVETDAEAREAVAGFALALDVTERDEQTAAKKAGMPWSVSKGHDTFCPISAPFVLEDGASWRDLRLWLDVNGQRRQVVPALALLAVSGSGARLGCRAARRVCPAHLRSRP